MHHCGSTLQGVAEDAGYLRKGQTQGCRWILASEVVKEPKVDLQVDGELTPCRQALSENRPLLEP